jgi:putative membrane protein
MINYNPKEWFTFIFRITKVDTLRKLLPLLIGVGIYSALIAFLELNYFKLDESSSIRNVGLMHTVLGFVISLLLVFRTNTAYDRWWEGRKIWGSLTNSSRNLAIKISVLVKDDSSRQFYSRAIPLYASVLKNHLRENEDFEEAGSIFPINKGRHIPNQVALHLYNQLVLLQARGHLTVADVLILNEEIREFTNICGACERIKNTPIPFTYSVFIKKFIFFYVMTLPFGWVFSLSYFIIPVVILILYAFASLELIAEEIENPFGTDADDLPIDQICANIKKHVTEILS